MSFASSVVLKRTGDKFPLVGLGTWKAGPGKTREAVEAAIKLGYRHLDCACDYGNEGEVGEAIAKCISEGVVKREDLFITSKLWNTFHAKEHVEPAIRRTLSDLKLDYLDLYLIHFPISLKFVPFEKRYPPEWIHDPDAPNPKMELADVPIHETWAGMEAVCQKGLARNIGVSNFNCQSIMDLMKYARIKPDVNQVELHPYLVQEPLVAYCHKLGIAVTGYSPLGSSSYVQLGIDKSHGLGVLAEPKVNELAKKYGKSPAQIVLRWAIQRNVVVIPKSTKAERLAENLDVFNFQLSDEDFKAVSALDRNARYNDPLVYCTGMGEFYPIFN